jgi:hypothetical protein
MTRSCTWSNWLFVYLMARTGALFMEIPYRTPRYTFCKLFSEAICEKRFPILRTLFELLSGTLESYCIMFNIWLLII